MGFIDGIFSSFGSRIAGSAFDEYDDIRQQKQQKALQDISVQGNKELADYSQEKQMQMWDATNYEAQMKHLKAAGLNAGLMYGKGGGGGTTTGSANAGSVSTGSAANSAQTSQASQGMALLGAQIANLQADTKKKEAEAVKTAGIDTELGGAQKSSIEQGIEQSRTSVDKMLSEIANIDNNTEISKRTKDYQIKIAQEEAVTGVLRNMIMAEQKSNIATDTKSKQQGITESKARINQMAENIMQGWEGLSQGDQKIAIEKFRNEMEQNYKPVGQVIGRSLDDLIEKIFTMGGKERGSRGIVMPEKK